MKLITIVLLKILASCHAMALPENWTFVSDEETLEKALQKLGDHESVWLLGSLADSLENEILEEMSQEVRWQKLQRWKALTFEQYRQLLLDAGLSILHAEVQREITPPPLREWIEGEVAPRIGLDPVESQVFVEEFFSRSKGSSGVYKRLLIQVAPRTYPK